MAHFDGKEKEIVPLSSKASIIEKGGLIISSSLQLRALKFVLLIGVMSFFADFVYEGSRGIIGPYLALLGASAFTVAVVTGFGEFVGYAWRLVSEASVIRRGNFGLLQSVVILSRWLQYRCLLWWGAGRWQPCSLFWSDLAGRLVTHRAMLCFLMLPKKWEDMAGPLACMKHLTNLEHYSAHLLQPASLPGAVTTGSLLPFSHPSSHNGLSPSFCTLNLSTSRRYERHSPQFRDKGSPLCFLALSCGSYVCRHWICRFSFMAYHLEKMSIVSTSMIPIFYAVAMGMSGLGSLLFGRLFDSVGIIILVPLTIISALFAPLVFLGSFWSALIGIAIWGMGMGVHESIIPAAVALMVPVQRRASAYGLFTASYGIFWFLGSAVIGSLYSLSLPLLITFCLVTEFASLPLFLLVKQQMSHNSRV